MRRVAVRCTRKDRLKIGHQTLGPTNVVALNERPAIVLDHMCICQQVIVRGLAQPSMSRLRIS
jgi:hypothetical protein